MLYIGYDRININGIYEPYTNIYIDNIKTNYIVTIYGHIFNTKTNKLLKPFKVSKGYLSVNLHIDGEKHIKKLHRLVANAFIKNPDNKPQVNHIDCNKTNNSVYNLEWVTNKENSIHAEKHRLRNHPIGENNGFSKFKEYQIHQVCMLLENNELTSREISNITGVTYGVVKSIKRHKSWTYVSKDYNIKMRKIKE